VPPSPDPKVAARPAGPKLTDLLAPYSRLVFAIAGCTIAANGLSLLLPKIMSRAIDTFVGGQLDVGALVIEFTAVAGGILLFTYLTSVVQVITSERVARDLRTRLVEKLSTQDLPYIQRITTATLLTNLTSDVDAVKLFVSQAVSALISSAVLIVGASALLISINWKLGLAVIAVLPVIAITFQIVLAKVRALFKQAQQAVDRLNKVISESILGAALVRLVNSQQNEYGKFITANGESRAIGLKIIRLFSALIPIIMFATNLATLMILTMGGRFVIQGSMSLGDFTAFNSYLAILIFPVIVIGFMSNVMAQAGASYARLGAVLGAPLPPSRGDAVAPLHGDITLDQVELAFGDKRVLKGVSFTAKAGTRTAVIGPTAAGKTQLLYLLTGLLVPTAGSVEYGGRPITDYDKASLHQRIAFVFQDATMFNLSLRENIAFSTTVKDQDLEKAIATAELKEFIERLPQKLDTVVSERGTSLSGGQKQRLMLARALALNPGVLLLDDFTARVDAATERAILDNVRRNYPGVTLLSVTQKIAPVEDYDQIIMLMEGDVLAIGTHQHLLDTCPEYVQLYDSQRSTHHYESVRAE